VWLVSLHHLVAIPWFPRRDANVLGENELQKTPLEYRNEKNSSMEMLMDAQSPYIEKGFTRMMIGTKSTEGIRCATCGQPIYGKPHRMCLSARMGACAN
jgi:hypothetical protein